MRYSTYNAIPQYPKSKKHPYETLEKPWFSELFLFRFPRQEGSIPYGFKPFRPKDIAKQHKKQRGIVSVTTPRRFFLFFISHVKWSLPAGPVAHASSTTRRSVYDARAPVSSWWPRRASSGVKHPNSQGRPRSSLT